MSDIKGKVMERKAIKVIMGPVKIIDNKFGWAKKKSLRVETMRRKTLGKTKDTLNASGGRQTRCK